MYRFNHFAGQEELRSFVILRGIGSIGISHRTRSVLSNLVNPRLAGVFERSILKSLDCFLFGNFVLETFFENFGGCVCPFPGRGACAGILDLDFGISVVFLVSILAISDFILFD